jgi:benzoate-CoA ligase
MKTKAFVVLTPTAAQVTGRGAQGLRQGASSPPYKYPRFQIVFVNELPKTATGKIQRFRLREKEKLA